jgi:hypothetical protein
MSVTFHAVGAPTKIVPCWMCEDHRRWEKDPTATCSARCDGMRKESVIAEANFSNHNARNILALLGLDAHDLCGGLSPEEIPAILQRLLTLTNTKNQRDHLVSPASVEKQEGKCTVVWGGNTDDQTLRRLQDVQHLLVESIQGGFGISWG